MEREQKITPLVSFSADGRFMHIDTRIATQRFISRLLYTLGSAQSVFAIRYFLQGQEFVLDSRELKTDDPNDDLDFMAEKTEELMEAEFIEVEKILRVPQTDIPEAEYT